MTRKRLPRHPHPRANHFLETGKGLAGSRSFIRKTTSLKSKSPTTTLSNSHTPGHCLPCPKSSQGQVPCNKETILIPQRLQELFKLVHTKSCLALPQNSSKCSVLDFPLPPSSASWPKLGASPVAHVAWGDPDPGTCEYYKLLPSKPVSSCGPTNFTIHAYSWNNC